MKRLYVITILFLVLVFASFVFSYISRKDSLNIVKANGEKIHIEILISKTVDQKTKGLSIIDQLPENVGMIFINDSPTNIPFWMYKMKFSVDIIFIDSQKKIIDIFENQKPCPSIHECPTVVSKGNYQYVLEVNAGFVSKHGIKVGDYLEF